MSDSERDIDNCIGCGAEMDVTEMVPFTNVICPHCSEHTRVKCQLGHYELTKRSGIGGMSEVFSAWDTKLEREVAIKLLNLELSKDEKRMEEFEREALITAAISHPNVVRVYTVGMAWRHFYIAMELVPNGSLEQRMTAHGALPEHEVLQVAGETIAGLRAARESGLIHRDIKPGNILFDANDQVKIVDFGLALVTQGGKATAEEIWATPYYVPPEALVKGEEDFRSDIYALGASLYHALTGDPPISTNSQSTREVLEAKKTIKPIAEVAPWLSEPCCELIDTAMEMDPNDRFASYAEMEELLAEAFADDRDAASSKPKRKRGRGRRRQANSWWKQPKIQLAGGSLLGAAALVFVISQLVDSDDDASDAEAVEEAIDFDELENALEGEGNTEEEAKRIVAAYQKAYSSLKNRHFANAEAAFDQLLADEAVMEPSRSWAGIGACLSAYLDGRSADAEASAYKLQSLWEIDGGAHSPELENLVKALTVLPPVKLADSSDMTVQVLSNFTLGLKYWEQGLLDESAKLMRKVVQSDLSDSRQLVIYKGLARNYLADYKTLQATHYNGSSKTQEEANRRRKELIAAQEAIVTNGRSKYVIQKRRLRNARELREMRKSAAQ